MRKTDRSPIFLDQSGIRYFHIRTFVLVLLILALSFCALSFQAVWGQKEDYLTKLSQDTNFDVINKISMQDPGKIQVNGTGTFIDISLKDQYQLDRSGNVEEKTVVLTFDDGPHPEFTTRILEVLEKEEVKASFFLVGENIYRYPETAKLIAEAGMEIGNHTFTHQDKDYLDYASGKGDANMDYELNFTQNWIQAITGVKTTLFRAPFWGTEDTITLNSLGMTTYALDKGYTVSAPTLDSDDWQPIPPERIVQFSTAPSANPVILLLHDGGGYRENTVQALPEIIGYYKNNGYKFTTLGELNSTNFNSAPNLWERSSSLAAVGFYSFMRAFPSYLNPIFAFGLVFSLIYGIMTVLLSLVEVFRRRRLITSLKAKYQPEVTVLIPAYNEETVIAKTIKSVLTSKYPKLKIIVIDDGSTDETYNVALSASGDSRVKIIRQKNGGKYDALNTGLRALRSSIFVSIDADTQIKPDTIATLVRFFQRKEVGAVGGNVRVGNRRNLLGILQSIEYTLSLNLERNAFSLLNSILVVPGALGAWRTAAVRKVGGYWGDTMTEDAELTLRMLKYGYRVLYDKDSVALTEAPQSVGSLVRQRFRWTYGVFQTFYLHRNLLFKRKDGLLGQFILPFTIFVQIPLMLLTPLMDLLAIIFMLFASLPVVEFYLGVYLAIRVFLGLLAYAINREWPWPLLFIPVSRFVYQPILYIPLYLAFFKMLKGTKMDWLRAKRYNSVNLAPAKNFYQVEYNTLRRKRLKPPAP